MLVPPSKIRDLKEPEGNQWNVYSGYAVEDKEDFSPILKVQPRELIPLTTGNIEAVDLDQESLEGTSVTITNYVNATYMGLSSNRTYPPDVRRGERVVLFQYADADEWFWYSSGLDDSMRTLEYVAIHAADIQQTIKEITDENSYTFVMDTLKDKTIRLKTAMSDSEEFIYTLELDAKNSEIRIHDNDENHIQLQTKVPRWDIKNKSGTDLELIDVDANLTVPNDHTETVGNNQTHAITGHIATSAANAQEMIQGIREFQGNSIGINANVAVTIQAPVVGVRGILWADAIQTGLISTQGIVPGGSPCGNPMITYPAETNAGNSTADQTAAAQVPAPADDPANRHTCAWEQVKEAISLICDVLDAHTGILQAGGSTDPIKQLAELSKMTEFKGSPL